MSPPQKANNKHAFLKSDVICLETKPQFVIYCFLNFTLQGVINRNYVYFVCLRNIQQCCTQIYCKKVILELNVVLVESVLKLAKVQLINL